jgi:hypothetical protein
MPYGRRERRPKTVPVGAAALEMDAAVAELLQGATLEDASKEPGLVLSASPAAVDPAQLDQRPLSATEKMAVALVADGLSVKEAAGKCGFKLSEVKALVTTNAEAVGILSERHSHKTRWALEDVSLLTQDELLKRLMKAHDLAVRLKDPGGAVAVIREMAKILGYYAPEVRKVSVEVNGRVQHDVIQQLPDSELLRIMHGEKRVEHIEYRGAVGNGDDSVVSEQ